MVDDPVVVLGAVVAAGEAAVVDDGLVDDGLVPVRPPPEGVEPDDVDVDEVWVEAVWLGVPGVVRVVSAMQSSAYSKRAKSAENLASKTDGARPRFHRWWTTAFAGLLSGYETPRVDSALVWTLNVNWRPVWRV